MLEPQSALTPDQQFWWNWTVNLAMAAATFLAVLVALFGERLWLWAFPPKLRMRLLEKVGEKTINRIEHGGMVIDREVRFFHLMIWNERRRWSPAHGVQLYLIALEELGPNTQYQIRWTGNVPMRWRDQESVPATQTIGAEQHADLLMMDKQDRIVILMPRFVPNNLTARRQGACRFVIRLQARSNEADSDVLRLEISWDGIWEDGDAEMEAHFKVEKL